MRALPFFNRPWGAKRILEIGGGHAPFSGVTHAVDKYPLDNSQRAGAIRVQKGVDFRVGELENLPFKPEERFDFLYLSHVLEHSPAPESAISEINRVASKGYIETPSPLREQLSTPLPFDEKTDFHLHFIWKSTLRENTIAYIRKTSATIGEFTPSKNGAIARKLYELTRAGIVYLEPFLAREAKTTRLYFRANLKIVRYESFAEAHRAGEDPYDSVRHVLRSIRFPFFLRSSRFRKLRDLLGSSHS